MKDVLGRALVTSEELNTVLLELEATVNDRPLGYVSGDLNEPLPITPSRLLNGCQLRPFPIHEVKIEEMEDSTLFGIDYIYHRVKYMSKLSNDLWKHWTGEYLLSLRKSSHRDSAKRGGTWPEICDIVLIHDDGPRLFWWLGKIITLIGGKDQQHRVVELQSEKGVTTRFIKTNYIH